MAKRARTATPAPALEDAAPTAWTADTEALQFRKVLWALVHALEVRSKRMARTIGVTGPQRLVVRAIGRQPDATAGDLARMLDLHASTLTGVLARLEVRGVIARHVDPEDRRRARFSLTAAGRRVDRERKGTVEAAVRRTLTRLPDTTATHGRALIDALVQELARPD